MYPSSLSLLSYLTSQFEIRDASGEYYVWFYFCVCLSTSLSSLFKESCVLILLFPKHKESFLSPKQSRAEVKEENYPQMELYKILSKYSVAIANSADASSSSYPFSDNYSCGAHAAASTFHTHREAILSKDWPFLAQPE